MQTRTRTKPGQSHWLGLALALAGIVAMLALAPSALAVAPGVTSVDPDSGSTLGGTDITITGTDFTGATELSIGGTVVDEADWDVENVTTINATTPAHAAGLAEIRVTNADGINDAGDNVFFTYETPDPAVTELDPDSGPVSGGTVVTITGTGFTGATGVTFGGVEGTAIDVNGDTEILITSPAHVAGEAFVVVTTPAGSSAEVAASEFTYVADLPEITELEPNEGPTAGGTIVTITGTGFLGATAVEFNSTNGTSLNVVNDTTITIVAPAHAVGPVAVTVTTPAGTSEDVEEAEFTYTVGGPLITILDPDEGPTAGGTEVTITGTGFEDVTEVMFGDDEATDFEVVDDTTILATSPAHAVGVVFVTIVADEGTSSGTVASQFTYIEADEPVVTGLDPDEGPADGGTEVTITGTGFTDATEVTFGGTDAEDFTVESDTEITATSPAHAAGAVQVRVTTEEGQSATGDDSEFTYLADDATITYNLLFRWTLISWLGTNGITVTNALAGAENPNNPDTNSIAGQVTAIYSWDAALQRWRGNFPAAGNVPGANDFTTLAFGTSYFFAVTTTVSWTVLEGP